MRVKWLGKNWPTDLNMPLYYSEKLILQQNFLGVALVRDLLAITLFDFFH
jgi:hypothetical protein